MDSKISNFHTFLFTIFSLQAAANTGLVIDISPSQFQIGLSDVLDVNCTFSNHDALDTATLISLVVSTANDSDENFTEIAAVTSFSPDQVKLLTAEEFKAEGLHSQGGESYLHLQWKYPDVGQIGLYQCAAHMIDEIGHCIVRKVDGQASAERENFGHIKDAIKVMKQDMEQTHIYAQNLEQQVTVLRQDISLLQQGVSEQDKHISDMNSYINLMERNMSHMINYTSSLEHKISDLRGQFIMTSGKFDSPPLKYNNKMYYLSNDMYRDVTLAQTTCNDFGGYLAEIDNSDEYSAVKKFLNDLEGFDHVLISGVYVESEGRWILPRTGEDLPFTQWYGREPDPNNSRHCLLLSRYTFHMSDIECEKVMFSSRFLCEMPR